MEIKKEFAKAIQLLSKAWEGTNVVLEDVVKHGRLYMDKYNEQMRAKGEGVFGDNPLKHLYTGMCPYCIQYLDEQHDQPSLIEEQIKICFNCMNCNVHTKSVETYTAEAGLKDNFELSGEKLAAYVKEIQSGEEKQMG